MTEKPEVRIGKGVKRISLQRFILSKIIYEPEKVGLREAYTLYDNQVWLETKALNDVDFFMSFEVFLEITSKLLKRVNFQKEVNISTLHRLTSGSIELKEFLIPRRNYGAWNNRFNGSFELRAPTSQGILKKFLPPKKVIGLGYRDKGTLKNLAFDGSPSWQEISSAPTEVAIVQAKKELENAKDFDDIAATFAKLFNFDRNSPYYSPRTPKTSKEIERGEARREMEKRKDGMK